jgi:hypothetical protein
MRRQRVVRKILLPLTPFLLAGVVLQVNGDVVVVVTADRARIPRAPQLRAVRRFLAQSVAPQPGVKLAIAQMICVIGEASRPAGLSRPKLCAEAEALRGGWLAQADSSRRVKRRRICRAVAVA